MLASVRNWLRRLTNTGWFRGGDVPRHADKEIPGNGASAAKPPKFYKTMFQRHLCLWWAYSGIILKVFMF
jgi:hypothetical protein